MIIKGEKMSVLYEHNVSLKGVTFNNDDGSSRQENIKNTEQYEKLSFFFYDFKGEPACAVYNSKNQQLGHLPAWLSKDIYEKYEGYYISGSVDTIYPAEDSGNFLCIVDICVHDERMFFYRMDDIKIIRAGENKKTEKPREKIKIERPKIDRQKIKEEAEKDLEELNKKIEKIEETSKKFNKPFGITMIILGTILILVGILLIAVSKWYAFISLFGLAFVLNGRSYIKKRK